MRRASVLALTLAAACGGTRATPAPPTGSTAAVVELAATELARLATGEGGEPIYYYEAAAAAGDQASPYPDPADIAEVRRLELGDRVIDVGRGHPPLPAELRIDAYHPDDRGPWVVQLDAEVPVEERQRLLAAAGAGPGEPVGERAIIARMRPAQARELAAASGAEWVGLLQPAYRMDATRVLGDGDEPVRVRVDFFDDVEEAQRNAALALFESWGAEVVDASGRSARIRISGAVVPALARVSLVRWLEPWAEAADLAAAPSQAQP